MKYHFRNNNPIMFNSKEEYKTYCDSKKKREKMNYSDLKNMTANQLLNVCGLENSVPIDLNKILKKFNISALSCDFDSMDLLSDLKTQGVRILGALIASGNRAAIFYNEKDKLDSHRCRFTIAHELAHCCLCGDEIHIEFRIENETKDKNEIAANTFAGEILIPEDMLKKHINDLILPSVHLLADIFEVSDNVMFERLKFLGIKEPIIGYNS